MSKSKKRGPVKKASGKKSQAALRGAKRAAFEKEGAAKNPRTWFVAGAIALIALFVVGALVVGSSGGGRAAPERVTVAGKQDYTSGNVEMVPVKATVAGGDISVPLAELKKNKFLSFPYSESGVEVPLLAMITPSGRLFTASSMCEPCKSDKFHTEPDGTLTCNACGTKWDLETMEGISGGCPNYPPQELKSVVRDGKIILKEADVRAWKPRTV